MAGTTTGVTVLPRDGRGSPSRRRRRQAVTFLALVLLVIAIGVGALGHWMRWWTFGEPTLRAAPQPCPTQPFVSPRTITVHVYNGTDRFGLARAVARELQARGFRVATVTTRSDDQPVVTPAEISYGPGGERAARTVAAQFGAEAVLTPGERQDAAVDVVLGTGYAAMTARDAGLAAIAKVPDPAGCIR